jgi:hypothetical protein
MRGWVCHWRRSLEGLAYLLELLELLSTARAVSQMAPDFGFLLCLQTTKDVGS